MQKSTTPPTIHVLTPCLPDILNLFRLPKATLKAVTIDRSHKRTGPVTTTRYDIAKSNWSLPADNGNTAAIDDNPFTVYPLKRDKELIIDLGARI